MNEKTNRVMHVCVCGCIYGKPKVKLWISSKCNSVQSAKILSLWMRIYRIGYEVWIYHHVQTFQTIVLFRLWYVFSLSRSFYIAVCRRPFSVLHVPFNFYLFCFRTIVFVLFPFDDAFWTQTNVPKVCMLCKLSMDLCIPDWRQLPTNR